jgi:hypothetical protein
MVQAIQQLFWTKNSAVGDLYYSTAESGINCFKKSHRQQNERKLAVDSIVRDG